jgi:hypothetical protein
MDMLCQGIEAALGGQVDGFVGVLRALPLLAPWPIQTRQVHRQALFFGNFLGQLQGEAIGVVELKGIGPGNLLGLWSGFLFPESPPAASRPAPGFPGSGPLPGPVRL